MKIEILGTESLGVRGLCCVVEISNRQIVIDPGLALGYQRRGLLPHPLQVAAGEDVRKTIVNALKSATDVIISHFHGDHMPLADANPYQLKLESVVDLLQSPRLWIKSVEGESKRIVERRDSLLPFLNRDLPPCEGQTDGTLTFSKAMPHGLRGNDMGTVMMTRVEDDRDVFVHASDIQLLDDEAVSQILDWKPTVLLVSGPSLYRDLTSVERKGAWNRAVTLVRGISTCIIDHHLLRCEAGVQWLDRLASETNQRVLCAADFMKRDRCFFEAGRSVLYDKIPVPSGWHESYAKGLEDTSAFRNVDLSLKLA